MQKFNGTKIKLKKKSGMLKNVKKKALILLCSEKARIKAY
jgi:hypothetical protein